MRRHTSRTVVIALVGALGLTAFANDPGVGAQGVGDRFFPLAGNGGYDVTHYDIAFSWSATTKVLRGVTRIEATAQQDLAQFDLDLRGFDVAGIRVNQRVASFVRRGQELVVRPSKRLRRGERLDVEVKYAGVPQTVIDADGSVDGWIPTDDGVIALSEPQGSPSWFPSNDHPSDKATFTIAATVPSELQVLSNGLPDKPQRHDRFTTHVWRETRPMATYLAMIAIGKFNVTTSRTASGIPVINAVDPRLDAASRDSLRKLPAIVEWESSLFGAYPFESVGAIADVAPNVGYALETQTRPLSTYAWDTSLLVHELAHQWFGDSLTVQTWPEIWLNEGFATYVEWLWSEHTGGATARQIFEATYATYPEHDPFWTVAPGPTALPGPTELFGNAVYERGAMTLQMVRDAVGDRAFFKILRLWSDQHRDGNVRTSEFIALVERVSAKPLRPLFRAWLDRPVRPAVSAASFSDRR